jgi:hypothetical protein
VKAVAKKSALFIFVFILFLAAHAGASSPAKPDESLDKWEFYDNDEDGTSYLYNASTVERLKGGLVLVWVQAIYTDKNPKYRDGRFLWELDCAKKRMRGRSAHVKKKDGTSETISESSDWSPIPPESTAETLHAAVCANKKKSKQSP